MALKDLSVDVLPCVGQVTFVILTPAVIEAQKRGRNDFKVE